VPQETVVSRKKLDIPWLLPTFAGVAILCALGSIGKMVRDVRTCQEDLNRYREPWERGE
jgi:hypothetical protein